MKVPPEATLNATPGLYKYDVQFTMSSGDVYTPLRGTLNIHEDQTREVLTTEEETTEEET